MIERKWGEKILNGEKDIEVRHFKNEKRCGERVGLCFNGTSCEAEAKAREQQRKRPPTEDGLQQLLRERTERKARDEATRLSVHAELKTRMDTGVRFNPLLARAGEV